MNTQHKTKANLFGLFPPYRKLIVLLIVLSLCINVITLWLPKLLSHGIDGYLGGTRLSTVLTQFAIASGVIFILTYIQNIVQTYASEKVARDLRNTLSDKIATRTFAEIESVTPAKLLTNLTSDIDSIKNFVSQAIVIFASSLVLILGGSFLLLSINWRLGLAVLLILPIVGGTFVVIFGKVRILFVQTREVIDWLNKVINESIIGAALIRVVNSEDTEHKKFKEANTQAKNVSTKILKLFAAMIPIITFASNLAVLIILVLGGKFVIMETMTLGEFASFNSYLTILIFPIIMMGFVSNIVAQAQASYGRIDAILSSKEREESGTRRTPLVGDIELEHVVLTFGEKTVLKDISIDIKGGTKVAIIGPTAAGKTLLLNLMIGLIKPTTGTIYYDKHDLHEHNKESLYAQVGLVFQDSIIFNMSIRENIAFNTNVTEEALIKAVETAELSDLIQGLEKGLDTVVSERGMSLSGGQKQRVMLARALAINPKILLLDDFTARVDTATENKIINNISRNYPGITLVSVTQKIASVQHYDQIVVLMEGEIVGRGTHQELMETSPEYVQIYNSQQSTNTI